MDSKIEVIRQKYKDIDIMYNELRLKLNELSVELREVLDNETDEDEIKKIIDFVYADGVEEIHEYAIRKLYLKD